MDAETTHERPETPSEPHFGLGLAQLRLLLTFVVVVTLATAAVNEARLTFLVPRTYQRSTLALWSYRTLEEPQDVVLVGSSRMGYSFDARLLMEELAEAGHRDVSVYKVSQHGMRPWLLFDVLREQIAPKPPEDLLVLDMGIQFFNDLGLNNANALNQIGSIRDFAHVRPELMTAKHWVALLQLPFRGIQVPWNLDWTLRPRVREMIAHQQAHGGELSQELDLALYVDERRQRARLQAAPTAPEALPGIERDDLEDFDEGQGIRYDMDDYWFGKVLDLAAELPCDVLFVRTPVKDEFLDQITPETRAAFRSKVIPDIRAHGCGFVDMNRAPYPRDPALFADIVHMYPEGRERTSETFAREVLVPYFEGRFELLGEQ